MLETLTATLIIGFVRLLTGAQAFWPKGPDDPQVVVIHVTPHNAEFWDGDSRIVSTVKFAVALATGTVPSMGDNKKVSL